LSHARNRQSLSAARLSLLFAAALLFAARSEQKAENQKQPATAPAVSVGVAPVAKRATNPGLTVIGRVDAIDNVKLIARVEELLGQRTYEAGQAVNRGSLLFVLEKANDEARLGAAQAQADADNARQQADRTRALVRQQATSEAVLDDRVAQEKQTPAVVDQAKAALEQARMVAPTRTSSQIDQVGV